jgi:tRNA pseudouridine32 synthase/23S rRNA pseudouridine746 synthase/23S rRNA pseudouridine1911/1915/1917 synthase
MTAAAPRKPSPADEWRSRILYKDDRLLIIDKPAGLPVHGGPRGGPNLEALLPLLADHPKHVPMLAHRLDTDTSGCLILAKKRSALRKLHELFAAGSIGKTYWAVVDGKPPQASGTIDAPQEDQRRQRLAHDCRCRGHHATTDYKILGQADAMTWLGSARTGRTHQIRVHCASLGCPVLGDPVYGGAGKDSKIPMHLIARQVSIPFDDSGSPITAEAPVPEHLRANLRCGYRRIVHSLKVVILKSAHCRDQTAVDY